MRARHLCALMYSMSYWTSTTVNLCLRITRDEISTSVGVVGRFHGFYLKNARNLCQLQKAMLENFVACFFLKQCDSEQYLLRISPSLVIRGRVTFFCLTIFSQIASARAGSCRCAARSTKAPSRTGLKCSSQSKRSSTKENSSYFLKHQAAGPQRWKKKNHWLTRPFLTLEQCMACLEQMLLCLRQTN